MTPTEVLQQGPGIAIESITGKVKAITPLADGETNGKRWTVQNVTVTDGRSSVQVAAWNQPEMQAKSLVGLNVDIVSGKNKKGQVSPMKTVEKEYQGKTELRVNANEWTQFRFAVCAPPGTIADRHGNPLPESQITEDMRHGVGLDYATVPPTTVPPTTQPPPRSVQPAEASEADLARFAAAANAGMERIASCYRLAFIHAQDFADFVGVKRGVPMSDEAIARLTISMVIEANKQGLFGRTGILDKHLPFMDPQHGSKPTDETDDLPM